MSCACGVTSTITQSTNKYPTMGVEEDKWYVLQGVLINNKYVVKVITKL